MKWRVFMKYQWSMISRCEFYKRGFSCQFFGSCTVRVGFDPHKADLQTKQLSSLDLLLIVYHPLILMAHFRVIPDQ